MIEIHDEVLLPCSPAELAPLVDDLAAYPQWISLVHRAEPLGGDPPAWTVELRARLGPLARSKRLRMERTVHEPFAHARFERRELDGRRHGAWVLAAQYAGKGDATKLLMDLSYDGGLWTAGVLERTLHEEIERGKRRLVELFSEPTR